MIMEMFFASIDVNDKKSITSQVNSLLENQPEKDKRTELFWLEEQFNQEVEKEHKDYKKLKDYIENMKKNAESIVMVIEDRYLYVKGDVGKVRDDLKELVKNLEEDEVLIDSKKLFKRRVSINYNICEDTTYGDEQSAFVRGTGFFIKENVIATAAHLIIKAGYDIRKYRFVQNVIKKKTTDYNGKIIVSKFQVWKPTQEEAKIYPNQYEYFSNGSDWLILNVKPAYKPIGNIPPPLSIVELEEERRPVENDEVYSLGHGLGLSTKVSYEGKIQKIVKDRNFFECNLTLLGGNSGSPVFYADTHKLAGIYMRGVKKLEKKVDEECLIVKDNTTSFEGQENQLLDNVIKALNNL